MISEDHGIIMIVVTAAIIVLGLVGLTLLDMTSKDYVPERVLRFCEVSHEIYGNSYDDCINMYKANKK